MKKEIMCNENLKSIINRNLEELEMPLKEINEEIINDFFIYYLRNDYDQLYKQIQIFQKVIRVLTKQLQKNNEKSSYQLGIVSGITHVYKHLLNNEMADQEFNKRINVLLAHEDTKRILIQLYNYNDVQNKVLVELYGTYTNKLLNELIDINCVYKTKIGKFVLYNLTKIGRQFVKEHYIVDDIKGVNCFNKINKKKYNSIDKNINEFCKIKYRCLSYGQEKEKCQISMKY